MKIFLKSKANTTSSSTVSTEEYTIQYSNVRSTKFVMYLVTYIVQCFLGKKNYVVLVLIL